MTRLPFVVLLAIVLATSLAAASESPLGYYRSPSLNGDTVLFTAEGDLWTVGTDGGVARRLTSHLDEEIYGAISPDGEWVAFSADYEGPTEVYVMPLAGGLPSRITWHGDGANVVGWTPRGEVVYSAYYRVHRRQIYLEVVDPRTGATRPLPLMGAAEAAFDDAGTIFFTRYAFQGSHTRRYQGGTAQSLWRFDGADEAVPLTADHPGTDRHPMWWNDRLYFLSDRDASLDLWSMKSDGTDLQQHTHHHEWDVFEPSLHDGRIVYRLGADLRLLDLASGDDRIIPIRLSTDFDQRRVTWVDKPFDFLTSAYLSPDGDQVVLTARGEVFVAPVGQGRLVAAARNSGVRYRQARFAAGDDEAERDETIIALSDESGEVELWSLDPRGLEASAQLTDNGSILRFTTLPSPDGAKIAFSDKDNELWVFDRASGATTKIATSRYFGFRGFTWSPDSRWLAFSIPAENLFSRIGLYDSDAETGEGDEAIEILWATSDRFDSFDPVFSPDGKWLYFLSTRNLTNTVGSPWGPYAPQPHLDQTTEIFQLALVDGTRSPFAPPTELDDANKEDDAKQDNGKDKKKDKGKSDDAEAKDGATDDDDAITTRIEVEGLFDRLERVPTPAGNYAALAMTASHLY
ncbi:MAG: protease, partial [Acidobacteriota bacterium]